MDLRIMFLLFIMYSMIGWACEVINCHILDGKWINRGFLIGPYCPIYGCGAVLITLLVPQTNDIVATFLKAMTICSILEYFTSLIMEKLFKTRWWDYTNNKFNINGRICLETMIMFGIGGVAIVELASPSFLFELKMLSPVALNIISILVFIIFVTDVIISYNVIKSFKKIPRTIRKDSTEDMTKMVREELKQKNFLYKRLVYSFPDFETVVKTHNKKNKQRKEKNAKRIAEIEKRIEREQEKLRKLKK